jgi:CysZ protein
MNSFMKQFGEGITAYADAFRFIAKHKLWYLFLWPILFVIALVFVGFEAVNVLVDYLQIEIQSWIGLDKQEGALGTALSWAILIIVKVFFWLLNFSFLKYLVFILLSPLLAYVSEKVEKIETGKDYPFNMPRFVNEVTRGILMAIRNMLLEYVLLFILFIVSILLPFLVLITPFIGFFVSAYFYGFSFLDYNNERQQLAVKQSVALMKRNKGIAVGTGSIFSLLFLIPFLGIVLAPILGAVSSALVYKKIS